MYDLESVAIPDGVASIGDSAFSGCSGLTSVTISASVTYLGRYVFSGCTALRRVQFLGDAPTGEVTVPDGLDAAKVTVAVAPTVKTVRPNGATVRVVRTTESAAYDITAFLDMPEAGADGAVRGHDMVMSPYRLTYFAMKQGLKDDPFERGGGVLTLAKAYSYDPLANVPETARARVLGGEACLWSEYIWNEHDLAWRAWPRTCALAEILWTNPTSRDYADFLRRMHVHRPRLLRRLVNCAPLE